MQVSLDKITNLMQSWQGVEGSDFDKVEKIVEKLWGLLQKNCVAYKKHICEHLWVSWN